MLISASLRDIPMENHPLSEVNQLSMGNGWQWSIAVLVYWGVKEPEVMNYRRTVLEYFKVFNVFKILEYYKCFKLLTLLNTSKFQKFNQN